jgi:hypothetical protein
MINIITFLLAKNKKIKKRFFSNGNALWSCEEEAVREHGTIAHVLA